MRDIDIESLSHAELLKLKKNVDKAITVGVKRKKVVALVAAKKIAAHYGFSLEELLQTGPDPKGVTRSKVPKYKHPQDPAITWSGLGRKPAWVRKALEAGTSLESLSIDRNDIDELEAILREDQAP